MNTCLETNLQHSIQGKIQNSCTLQIILIDYTKGVWYALQRKQSYVLFLIKAVDFNERRWEKKSRIAELGTDFPFDCFSKSSVRPSPVCLKTCQFGLYKIGVKIFWYHNLQTFDTLLLCPVLHLICSDFYFLNRRFGLCFKLTFVSSSSLFSVCTVLNLYVLISHSHFSYKMKYTPMHKLGHI